MAHGISWADNMAYTASGGVPWHGLGNVWNPDDPFEINIKKCNLNWRIEQRPSGFIDRHGVFQPIADTFENVRILPDGTELSFNRVSDHYKPFHPEDAFRLAHNIAEEIGAKLETAGTLFNGRHYWALLKVGESSYILDRDDLVGSYIMLSSSADGSRATDARRTSIRAVCNNTVTWALRTGKAAYRQTHKSEVCENTLKASLGINVGNVMEEFHREMETYRALANAPLVLDQIVELTGTLLYGDKYKEADDKDRNKMLEKKAARTIGAMAATGRGLLGKELRGGSGTAWAWLNSVTQYVDHDAVARNTGNATAQENRLDSAWFGNGAKLKRDALSLVTEYVGANGKIVEGSSALDMVLNAA